MENNIENTTGTWRQIADAANVTINRKAGTKEPTNSWKKKILLAEHSPIRQLKVLSLWTGLKYWVSVHLVRHKFGIDHWIRTQRTDRTNVNRDELPQGAEVEHEFEANAQAIINISRKRLCNCASPETRDAWKSFLKNLKVMEPVLESVCVPECVYRGFCPESFQKTCKYSTTVAYYDRIQAYRSTEWNPNN
jgi:hypothetical protein